MDKQEQFISSIAKHAQDVQKRYGVPASIAIAQAALETGWGTKVKGNNLYGVKAGSTWSGETIDMRTHEYFSGVRTDVTDKFRAYGSAKDSMNDYARLLSKPHYAKVVAADSAHEAADELQRAGYATDPRYSEKLKSIIDKYNLTRFDDASYQGYTQGNRFQLTRQRLQERRTADPEPWNNFLETFLGLLSSLFAGLGNSIFGDSNQRIAAASDATHVAAPMTPTGSRVAAVAKNIPARG